MGTTSHLGFYRASHARHDASRGCKYRDTHHNRSVLIQLLQGSLTPCQPDRDHLTVGHQGFICPHYKPVSHQYSGLGPDGPSDVSLGERRIRVQRLGSSSPNTPRTKQQSQKLRLKRWGNRLVTVTQEDNYDECPAEVQAPCNLAA
jgi:hypothetical protein